MAGETKGVLRDLGLRIRELRRSQGLTQEELSEKLGMLAPNYARIEQGRMNTTVETLVRIAKALKVDIVDLFAKPKTKKVSAGRPRKSDE